MKNLKKVLAFTLALAMVLSTMTTTFAANETVDKLSNLGLLLNTSEEEVNAELTRSVGLAMVLKTLGYTQEDSNAKAAENTFVDMGLAEWAKGFAAIGEELKITNGISVEPKMFAPAQKLDKKSFVTFMLRALGYDTNEAWEKAAALAQESKLVSEQTLEDANFTKGEAAMIMYNALKAPVQKDAQKRSLAQKLVDEGKLNKDLAVANGVIDGVAATLEVVSVSATNLREVNVMFNTKVDKASAEKAANYRLKGRTLESAAVQEDGKTVVLTVENALANKKETKLTITGVKTEAGNVIAKTETMFTPFDDQYPKVEKITFTGPKNLSIQFSEPIKNSEKAVVTLRANNRRYSTKVDKVERNMAYVTAYTSFKNGEEYLVAIGDPNSNDRYFYDYANYPNTYYEETMTYEKDMTAPEAEVVNAGQKVVKIKFNKPVTGVNAKHFYHSFASYTANTVYSDAKMTKEVNANDTVTEVWVDFYKNKTVGRALPAGDVTLTVLGRADDKTEIKDAWGNKFESVNIPLTIVADREAPEVVEVSVVSESEVKVTFNEPVSNGATATYTLSNKSGSVARSNSQILATTDGSKAVKLNFNKSYAGKTMILSIKGVKDDSLYQNMMVEYSTEFEFTDKVWAGIDKVEFAKEGTENPEFYLYVTYKEDMGESATDNKNYKFLIGETTYNLKGEGDFFEGRNNIVRFALTYDKKKDDNSTDVSVLTTDNGVNPGTNNDQDLVSGIKLLVSQDVKDLAGNKPNEFQKSADIVGLSKAEIAKGIKTAVANTTDRVEVKFAQEMSVIDGSEFELTASNAKKYSIGGYNVVDNKTLELFLVEKEGTELFGTNLAGNSATVEVSVKADAKNTKDIFNRMLDSAQKVEVADKIAPATAKFVLKENKGSDNPKAAFADSTKDFVLKKNDDNSKYDDEAAVIGYKADDNTYMVKVGYTENIQKPSVSNTTFTLNNSDFKVRKENGFDVADNVVTLNLVKVDGTALTDDDVIALKGLTISQDSNVRDAAGNTYAGAGTLAVVQVEADAAPVVKTQVDYESAVLTGTKEAAKLVITYNVELKEDTAAIANFTIVDGDNKVMVDTDKAAEFAIAGKTITIPVKGIEAEADTQDLKVTVDTAIEGKDAATTTEKAVDADGREITNEINFN